MGRLTAAINTSRLTLQRYRTNRYDLVREYAGARYSENAAERIVPVNLLSQYVTIVSRNLIAQNPRVMLSTFRRDMKPMISAMEDWANLEIDRMKLKTTLERGVFDALFSIGIVKVALATPGEAANAAWVQQAGTPFAATIDLDDFVFNTRVRDFREAWMGHRYRVPIDVVKSDHRFTADLRARISPSQTPTYNQQGDERIEMLGRGWNVDDDFEDMVDLWEIYLPRYKVIITLADTDMIGGYSGRPLHVQEWVGPDCGPYHILGMGTMPGNPMPKAPLMDLLDLHLAFNNAYRKLIRRVHDMKNVTLYRSGASEDADRVKEASDQEFVKSDDPTAFNQIKQGGGVEELQVITQSMQQLFSWLGGNLDSMGGLSPQAKTLGQDAMLERNSSKGIAYMQDRVVEWTSDILESLCWYWYHDPYRTHSSEYKPTAGGVASITRKVTPEMRMQGSYEELKIAVDPYSLQHSTPQQRMTMLNQVVTNVLTPMMPILQQQGIGIDINAYLTKMAKYMDMPDLADIVSIVEPPGDQGGAGGGGDGSDQMGPQPANTTRTYVRENRPGRTMQGDAINALNAARGNDTGGASGQQQGAA